MTTLYRLWRKISGSDANKAQAVNDLADDIDADFNQLANKVKIYEAHHYTPDTSGAGLTIRTFYLPRALKLPANFAGSGAKAGAAATGATTFSITKNGAPLGSLTFAPGATSATFAATAETTFAAGDRIGINAPATADATLSEIAFCLVLELV